MKVYFDDDGRLRHHGCDGPIIAGVESHLNSSHIYRGDDWAFPKFTADITVDLLKGWHLDFLECEACCKLAVGYDLWQQTELVTEDGDEL